MRDDVEKHQDDDAQDDPADHVNSPISPRREHRGIYSRSLEGGKPGDRAAHDQRVDVVRAFVGVDRLEVRGVAHHLEFGGDAVAAVHVAGDAGDIERLAAIVALDQADRLGDQLALFEPAADAQRRLQAQA